jgi:hypothetical protein
MVMVEAAKEPGDWQPAVEAVPSAIALSELHRPELTVVLSNHFVRYAVLPANGALKRAEEWLALARHRLAAVHGAAAADWAVRVSAAAPGGERIACAADAALVEALKARVNECGARLASVQPNLMTSFNALRKSIGEQSCWLVIKESGRLTLALIENGAWRAIRSRRMGDGWSTLREILERECAVLALDQPYTRTVIVVNEDFAVNGNEPFHVPDWTGEDDFDKGAAAMAQAAQ